MARLILQEHSIRTYIVAALIGLISSSTLLGQESKIVEGGVISGIPYASTQFEDINLTNGALNLNFPLASLKGRGSVSHSYALRYNSKLWQTVTNPVYNPNWPVDPTYQNFMADTYDSGWQDNGHYYYILWNRNMTLDFPGGDICSNGQAWAYAYRWKLEMVAPGGRKIEFRPIGFSDIPPGQSDDRGGYFNVHPDGKVTTVQWSGSVCYGVDSTPSGNRTTYYSSDGSGIRLTFANQEQLGFVWEMSMPDGSRIIEKVGGGQKIIDRNGNFIESTTITLPDSSQAPGWIDEVGRWIARKIGAQTNEDHYYQLGFNGELLTTKVIWKDIFVRRNYVTTCAIGCAPNERGPVTDQQVQMSFRVVDRIELPSQLGGLEYQFKYHAKDQDDTEISPGWGEVKSIEMPTGAKISYGYKLSALSPEEEYNDLFENELFLRTDQILERAGTISKKVLEYEETYDGQTEERKDIWGYSISRYQSSVIGPDGTTNQQFFYDIVNDVKKGGQVYKEIKGDGTIVERIWQNNFPVGATYGSGNRLNPFVKTELITIPNSAGSPALSMIRDYNFDQNGNPLMSAEYDWISSSSGSIHRTSGVFTGFSGLTPARSSATSYYNGTPEFSSTTSSANAYYFATAPYLRSLTAASEVKDSSGTPVSRTEIYYDNLSTPTVGNPTEIRTWDSFKGGQYRSYSAPLTTSNSISTFAEYDSFGNVTKAKDANGVETVFNFGNVAGPSGNVTGLYPTKTEAAANYSSLKRTSTAVFDFYTGLVTSAKDEDNDVTVVTEYDDLGRPVKVRNAYGTVLESWTTSEYDDVNRRIVVRSDLEVIGDGRKVAIKHFDQLGRVRLSRTLEDSSTESPYNEHHGIKVQTRYRFDDGENPTSSNGVFSLTSNPYRAATSDAATNEETMGWVVNFADKIGRFSTMTTYSGATLPAPWGGNSNTTGTVSTNIDADRTLVMDQAGKSRISRTNALGQLKEVWEILAASETGSESITFPGTSIAHGFKTTYDYDTLNNLTTVNQGSQQRDFTYSSLSRLLSATNPESGTISYGYDSNGNLTSKVDARNITTNYSYDALNRVTQRSYSGESGYTTPTVTYTYGTTAPAIGRLTKVESSISTTEYTEFDILGRIKAHKQTTDGQHYTTGYVYNLSGALIEQTYPSGRKVKNTLDGNGDLAQVHSQKSSTDIWRPYASNFVYTAAGAVSSMKLGNGRFENTAFNSRLQPTQIGLGSSATDQGLLKLNYDYGTTNNNGNILSQTITVPTVGQTPGFIAVQNYTYDSLNRLKSATENVDGNPTPSWQQTFTFDRYGNRSFNEASTTTLPKECTESGNPVVCEAIRPIVNPSANAANNRLSSTGWQYDTSGNTIVDAEGRQFTYDAENKQVKVKDSQNQTIGEYFYNGDGLRIKKVVPSTGETTIFAYDASNRLVAEYSTLVEPPATAKTSYLTTDHLGSPRIITDQFGQTASRRDFMPFGEEIARLNYGADSVRQKFASKERDDETGLDDFLARQYSSSLGRFTSPDPLIISFVKIQSPQTWNLYAYVGNNPFSYMDPTGMERVKLGQHTDEEIEKRLKEVNKEIDRIGKIKNKTDEQKKEQEKLKAERTTLGIEKEGNKVVGALLKSLESRGELNGLKLSDFTVTTDSANDFKDEPRIVGDPGAGAAMFVLNGYSKEIFINTKSNDYALYKSGDADAVLYGGTALRHEQVHRDNYPNGDTSEKAAYTEQLKILQKYGPGAFRNKEFYKTVLEHVTKGTQKTN